MSCPGYDRHPGQIAERGADVALQERPAGQDPGYAAVLLAEPVSGQLPAAGSGGVAADSAVRAVYQCQPYELPSEKYAVWRDMILNFDPRQMYGSG